jgi:DNA-binding NtrC family response regulator
LAFIGHRILDGKGAVLSGMKVAQSKGMNKPIRILFVEDDPEMMAIYLENFLPPDYLIATASTAEGALQILDRADSRFDVVVTDNYMPGITGISLLQRINQKDPSIKLLMVTGYGSWAEQLRSRDSGYMKFVDKPVKMSDLRSMIERMAG